MREYSRKKNYVEIVSIIKNTCISTFNLLYCIVNIFVVVELDARYRAFLLQLGQICVSHGQIADTFPNNLYAERTAATSKTVKNVKMRKIVCRPQSFNFVFLFFFLSYFVYHFSVRSCFCSIPFRIATANRSMRTLWNELASTIILYIVLFI